MIFFKTVINFKISCISTSFEKEITILNHIAKQLQARQYLKIACYSKTGVKIFFSSTPFISLYRWKNTTQQNVILCINALQLRRVN